MVVKETLHWNPPESSDGGKESPVAYWIYGTLVGKWNCGSAFSKMKFFGGRSLDCHFVSLITPTVYKEVSVAGLKELLPDLHT